MGSPKFDFLAADRWNKVGALLEGSFFKTNGFPIVAPIERGPIDNNADVDYRNVSAKIEYTPSESVNAFFRAGYFDEDRNNAKVGELNDTRWTTINGGVRARLRDGSDLQGRVFGDISRAHFNFLAVTNPATTRNLVRLATDQHVPTNAVGDDGRLEQEPERIERVQRGCGLALDRRREPGRRLQPGSAPGHYSAGDDRVGPDSPAVSRAAPSSCPERSSRISSRHPRS